MEAPEVVVEVHLANDLLIVLGMFSANGEIPTEPLSRDEFTVELTLTGELRLIRSSKAMTFSMMHDTPNLQNKWTHQKRAFVLPQNSAT